MTTPFLGVAISGDKALINALFALPDKVFRRGVVIASRRAMKPVIEEAKAKAPRESGALSTSVGVRVKSYKKTGTVVTVVGPRQGYAKTFNNKLRNPFYYAHLVEKGHKVVKPGSLKIRFSSHRGFIRAKGTGKTLGWVAGIPFLRPSLEHNQDGILGSLKSELGSFVEREAKRA